MVFLVCVCLLGPRQGIDCSDERQTESQFLYLGEEDSLQRLCKVTDTSVGYNNLQYRIYEYHLSLSLSPKRYDMYIYK